MNIHGHKQRIKALNYEIRKEEGKRGSVKLNRMKRRKKMHQNIIKCIREDRKKRR